MSTIPQGRHRRRALGGTALLTAALIVVAACSSSKSSSSTATTAAASATTAAAGPTTTGAPKTITVTLIGSFTGQFASSSVSINKALQYAFDNVNNGTAPISAPGFTFKVVAADDGGVASKALDLARTAQSNGSHIIDLIGHAEVDAVSTLTNSGQLLGVDTDPPDVSGDGTKYPYTFDFFPLDKQAIGAEMKMAASKNLTKFAIIAGTGTQYQGYVDDVNATLSTAPGASVVDTERFDPTTTDFSSIATKIHQAGADSIWFFGTGPVVQAFFQALIAAKINVPIFNSYGVLSCTACYTMPKSFTSQIFVPFPKYAALGADGTPAVPQFGDVAKAQWAHFNLTSLTDKALQGPGQVDEGYALAWMVKQAGGDDPAKIKAVLEATGASGGIGFIAPDTIKYAWTPTQHGGYPPDQVGVVNFGFSATWPGFWQLAS